jgi:hypothetical protein
MSLSRRERVLLGMLAGVACLAAAFFTARGVTAHVEGLRTRIETAQSQLQLALAAREELERTQRAPKAGVLREPLLTHLEQIARGRGLSDRLQLNSVPQERGRKLDAVEVKLDSLTLDEMLNFVNDVESSRAAIGIDQFELSPSFRARDLIRLTMRVVVQR